WQRTQLFDLLDYGSGIIAFVRNYIVGVSSGQQRRRLGDIITLSTREHKIQWVAQRINNQMNLGAETGFTASQRLLRLPPLTWGAPAAQGWARMIVLSSTSHSRSGSWMKW